MVDRNPCQVGGRVHPVCYSPAPMTPPRRTLPVPKPPAVAVRRAFRPIHAVFAFLAACPALAGAAERAVPGDHATLAEALAASAAGDVVVVAGGTYAEHDLDLPGGVTVRARPGDVVTLDAQEAGRHFVVRKGGESALESIRFVNGITLDRQRKDGGSLLVDRDAHLTIRDCSFTAMHSSHYGGTIACQPGVVLTLERCSFENSRATRNLSGRETSKRHLARDSMADGGVIHLGRRTKLTATDCRFADYHAKDGGGAIFVDVDGAATLTNCTFDGGSSMEGGAISGKGASIELADCTFTGNLTERTFRAPGRGGALFLEEGSLAVRGGAFRANVADQGGAVYLFQTTAASFDGTLFAADTASGGGGALMAIDVPTTIANSVFHANVAGKTSGGAILFGKATLTVTGSTFHANVAARDGSAIYASTPIDVKLDRCIVSGGRGAGALDGIDGRTMRLTCCNLSGNEGGDWVRDVADQAGKDGNLSADPRYRDAKAGDLALAKDSPCRDAKGCGRIGADLTAGR